MVWGQGANSAPLFPSFHKGNWKPSRLKFPINFHEPLRHDPRSEKKSAARQSIVFVVINIVNHYPSSQQRNKSRKFHKRHRWTFVERRQSLVELVLWNEGKQVGLDVRLPLRLCMYYVYLRVSLGRETGMFPSACSYDPATNRIVICSWCCLFSLSFPRSRDHDAKTPNHETIATKHALLILDVSRTIRLSPQFWYLEALEPVNGGCNDSPNLI